MNQDLTTLMRRHSVESLITLLGMHDADEWQIELSNDQAMARMEEIFREAGMPSCVDAVRSIKHTQAPDQSLTQFWKQILQPSIAASATLNGEDQLPGFKSTMSKAHPANSRRKLHPKATGFLEHDFALHVEKHLKLVDGQIVKTA